MGGDGWKFFGGGDQLLDRFLRSGRGIAYMVRAGLNEFELYGFIVRKIADGKYFFPALSAKYPQVQQREW